MKAAELVIELTPRELMYLKNTRFLPPPLLSIVDRAQLIGKGKHIIHASPDVAEDFRSAFTKRLAEVGFDKNYETTTEGAMLEELIDRFYLRCRSRGSGDGK